MSKIGIINGKIISDENHLDPEGEDILLTPTPAASSFRFMNGVKSAYRGLVIQDARIFTNCDVTGYMFAGTFSQISSVADLYFRTRSTYAFDFASLYVDNHVFYAIPPVLQTTDAAPTDFWSIPVAEGEIWAVEAIVIGQEGETNRAMYHKSGFFYRNTAGDVTIQGSITDIITPIETNAAWNCVVVADTTSQAIDVRVTGASNVDWKGWIKYFKVG